MRCVLIAFNSLKFEIYLNNIVIIFLTDSTPCLRYKAQLCDAN
jgi:hypothetical protein